MQLFNFQLVLRLRDLCYTFLCIPYADIKSDKNLVTDDVRFLCMNESFVNF